MSRFILFIVLGIFLFLILRLFKLLRNYSSGPQIKTNGRDKEKEEIRKHFENIEEAEFREIDPEDESKAAKNNNG